MELVEVVVLLTRSALFCKVFDGVICSISGWLRNLLDPWYHSCRRGLWTG